MISSTNLTPLPNLLRAFGSLFVCYIMKNGARSYVQSDGTSGPLKWTGSIHDAELYFDSKMASTIAENRGWFVEKVIQ